MLVIDPRMTSSVVLLVMVVLLAVVLMVRLMLVFLAYAHLHVSLVGSPIEYHVLPLAVILIIHGVGVVRACLRDG